MARFSTDTYELEVYTDAGPRISRYGVRDGENLLIDLPTASILLDDGREYRLRGGHRLWTAPEVPQRTYVPDDAPCVVTSAARTVTAVQPAPEEFPIERSITVSVGTTGVEVTHQLTNRSDSAIRLAPWAITQLVPGGVAIMPLDDQLADAHGLQPNRELVAWPYTDLDAVSHRDGVVLISGEQSRPLKVGTPLTRGWLGYLNAKTLFIKRVTHQPGAVYADRGASGQVYANSEFVELETLGPLVDLEPSATTSHEEWWELHQVDTDDPLTALRAAGVLDS